MSGSFASINTALTALRYQQTALDIASTNVANVGTDGYVRRRVVGETLGAASAPARWSRSTETASGVQAARVDRMTDALLDSRVRREHGRQAKLDGVATALARIETGLAEPGSSGVSAALADFRKTLADLGNAPSSEAARSQAFEAAKSIVDAVGLQSTHLDDEAGDQRAHLLSGVNEVNSLATEIAATNRTIAAALNGSSDTTTLMDERDALTLRLAELTGAKATLQDDGSVKVELGGKTLVSGSVAEQLAIVPGDAVAFASDPLKAPIDDLGGDLGATVQVITADLPAYKSGLQAVAQSLVTSMQAAQAKGFDAAGDVGGKFFDIDPTGKLVLALPDASKIAVSAIGVAGSKDGNNAAELIKAANVDDEYQRLVNGFGSKVASAQQLAKNQQALTDQVDSAREQLAGVSLDEETVNMISAQHAYEAAARVMTTLDSVLDTLINRTGLVR